MKLGPIECTVGPHFIIPSIYGYKSMRNRFPLECAKLATGYPRIYAYFRVYCVHSKPWLATGLNESDVEDLLDEAVVGGDLVDGARRVLDTDHVHRHQVVGHSAPEHLPVLLAHLEYLRPQPATHHRALTYSHIGSLQRRIFSPAHQQVPPPPRTRAPG